MMEAGDSTTEPHEKIAQYLATKVDEETTIGDRLHRLITCQQASISCFTYGVIVYGGDSLYGQEGLTSDEHHELSAHTSHLDGMLDALGLDIQTSGFHDWFEGKTAEMKAASDTSGVPPPPQAGGSP